MTSEFMYGEDEAPLTENELIELNEALGDGFTSVSFVPSLLYGPISDVIEEPFWGASIHWDETEARRYHEYAAAYRKEGLTEDGIFEEYMKWTERSARDEGAPSWQQSNPFSFEIDRLDKYFVTRCHQTLGEFDSILYPSESGFEFRDLIEMAKPFSKAWHEFQIAFEFWLIRSMLRSKTRPGAHSSFWVRAMLERVGSIGRLIESYRWRFAYGSHALRGKKTLGSAGDGGRARAATLLPETKRVLDTMKELIENGHSISRAGEIAFSRGNGSSGSANRKLWQRRKNRRP